MTIHLTKYRLLASLLIFVLMMNSLVMISLTGSEYENFDFNAVDADSDIDSTANKGTNSSSYLNAVSLNGVDQEIIEADQGGGSKMMLQAGLIPVINPVSGETVYLNTSEGNFQELYEARGQTSQHFYNITSNTYSFKSNLAVKKQNVLEKTDWILAEEYPIRFVVRLRNGSIYFEYLAGIINLFSQIDNASLWGVGVEGFKGVMGFFMNFEAEKCFGQYLYYPRFLNGSLPDYNYPLAQIFPHMYVNLSGTLYDKIFIPSSTARNRLVFTNDSGVLGLYYTFQDSYLSRTFQFRYGLKYNISESRFHFINHFVCTDQSFDDIGFAYEMDRSELTEGTNYRPYYFTVRNESYEKTVNVTQALDFKQYVSNCLNEVKITALNNKWSFLFSFDDMQEAGFTQSYLSIHDQLMPDDSTRKVLRAGMFAYGSYTQNTIIEIDPTFSEKQSTDALDFFVESDYDVFTAYNYFRVGNFFGTLSRAFIAWNTGITSVISETSNAEFTFYVQQEDLDAGDYIAWALYDKLDDDEIWNETEGTADGQGAYAQTGYWNETDFWSPQTTGNVSIADGAGADTVIDQWVNHHNDSASDRAYIGIKMYEGSGIGFGNYLLVDESSYATASYRPTLSFDYTLYTPPSADFELEWEHQVNSILARDHYNLTVYGFSNESEKFQIELWNTSSSSWVTTTFNISSSETWYNFSIDSYSSLISSSTLTYRFKDEDQSGDTSATLLSIDYSGITCFDDLNGTPSFTAWYEAPDWIEVGQSATFYATIQDKDNSSGELTVTLFYSNDSFVSDNNSQAMTYDSTPSANNYKYVYTMSAQPEGTTYKYYYKANDGITYLRKPTSAGVYFTILWDSSAPSFSSWYQPSSWIEENTNVTFYAVIEDIDNSSGELSVTLYYSDDNFVSDNNSASLSYDSTPESNHYNYSYEMEGKAEGTTYKFYYWVTDGVTIVKQPTSTYYTITWDSSAPSFSSWYQPTTLIVPNDNVLFYVVIEDIDNSSGELSVKLYFSNDSFGSYNESASMSYSSTPSANHYRFTYLFPGKPGGTRYDFYYWCSDNITEVKKPTSSYYYIQWDAESTSTPGGDGTGGDGDETTPVTQFFFLTGVGIDWWLIIILVFIGVIAIISFIYLRNPKKKKKR